MHGPKGTKFDKDMYSAGTYLEVVPKQKIVATDYFSDSKGNKITPKESGLEDPDFPDELIVTVLFEEVKPDKTKLTIVYPEPSSREQKKAMLKSGMKDGWNSTLDKLDRFLTKSVRDR